MGDLKFISFGFRSNAYYSIGDFKITRYRRLGRNRKVVGWKFRISRRVGRDFKPIKDVEFLSLRSARQACDKLAKGWEFTANGMRRCVASEPKPKTPIVRQQALTDPEKDTLRLRVAELERRVDDLEKRLEDYEDG